VIYSKNTHLGLMRNAGRWKPAKKRSAVQRAQLGSINTCKPSNQALNTVHKPQLGTQKENYSDAPTSSCLNNLHSNNPPEPLEDQLVASELCAKHQYHNEVKKTTRAKKRNEVLQEQLKTVESDTFLARTTSNTLHVSTSAELDRTWETLAWTERSLAQMQDRVTSSSKARNRLSMRLAHTPAKVNRKLSQPYQTKKKGVIREETR
jgi:hypothetical protein